MNDVLILVLGTSALLVMITFVISFAFLFQRRLIRKQKEFSEIEAMLKKQELASTYALIRGQDDERKRIASDIHDNIGSMLATLKIYSDLIVKRPQDDESFHLNQKINWLIEGLILDIRKISHSLDTGTLTDFGLRKAIEQLCETIHNSRKVDLKCILDLESPIGADASLHLYRVIQELFTNTLKHARATRIRIEITEVTGEISIIYEDNGIGFDPATQSNTSMGLRNIRSRILKLGGELSIQSSPLGSTFIIEIPFKNASIS
jgi:two-component system, NarL family, sensor kinase